MKNLSKKNKSRGNDYALQILRVGEIFFLLNILDNDWGKIFLIKKFLGTLKALFTKIEHTFLSFLVFFFKKVNEG
ncbi:hypothetical protein [Bartonella massiliensis]|uniref:hypothetical protein n=1 Tax=Bartonella massiliensis TaxID=929795 RepID=UPI0011585A00|nr:hypothetical protein [Bartonella massiliensis]